MDCGALDALVICLEEFDPGVKEAAAWALGYIARHNSGISIVFICLFIFLFVNWQNKIKTLGPKALGMALTMIG